MRKRAGAIPRYAATSNGYQNLNTSPPRGGRNGVQIKYELLTDAEEDGTGYHVGLIDVAKLRKKKSA